MALYQIINRCCICFCSIAFCNSIVFINVHIDFVYCLLQGAPGSIGPQVPPHKNQMDLNLLITHLMNLGYSEVSFRFQNANRGSFVRIRIHKLIHISYKEIIKNGKLSIKCNI